jgi:CubicO group peptidase (beta-lactamase class C family)
MGIIRTMPLVFIPGTKYQYSNTGFYVLGAIVAQVSGQSYYGYMRQHVFSRAGMTRTGFYTQPQMLASRDIAHPMPRGTASTSTSPAREGSSAARTKAPIPAAPTSSRSHVPSATAGCSPPPSPN